MLNRVKFMQELSVQTEKLFFDHTSEYEKATAEWKKIAADPYFLQKVQAQPSYLLATWEESVSKIYDVHSFTKPYTLVSVDGSQIYPDKHQGTSCFLINIGTVVLRYGQPSGAVSLASEPFLFVGQEDDPLGMVIDMVDAKREEFEFSTGLEVCSALQSEQPAAPLLFLFDGSLIFWHLDAKEAALKDYFLESYCTFLLSFYEKRIPVAGYISLPKSKDLVNLVRAGYTNFAPVVKDRTQHFAHTVDTLLASSFLQPGQRTTLFKSHVAITASYPEMLHPWFCYYATEQEIVRLEFPEYVATDPLLLEQTLSIVADQVVKGNGYPVSIAEAHMLALVKGSDRDFFYQAVERQSIVQKQRIIMSQKSAKKKRMSV